jgi:hypothetical protein
MEPKILEQLAKLRAPFPANQISKLPKETKQQAEERKADMEKGIKCDLCGGWHHRNAVHLDYVGHAAATDRLLDVDPLWTWEPMATDANGLPALDRNGNMWIKLTVCGVSRFGYGAADGKTGGDAVKEIIGDAIRNAGMRFGMALDLWHKGDLHVEDVEPAKDKAIRELRETIDGPALVVWWGQHAKPLRAMLEPAEWAEVERVKDQMKAKHEAPANEANPFEDAA